MPPPLDKEAVAPWTSLSQDVKSRTGQILWIRGLTRLQTQLRVVRAFKSTLEDMEERSSVHSLHSLRSHPKQLSDISYIDEDVKTPSPPNDKRNHTPDGETAPLMVTSPGSTSSGSSITNNNRYPLLLEPTKIHETSI
ncbi:calcium-transporting ATPase [Trichonephila clavata]|uniref:Calcium-transporting ATPase n=1 Tax=Trichonephila clavata TaxID=2740835 RepID=A0A8X6I0Z3_TRICU|nr:calcium-transporting ATPase [Trichonephila clavata]